MKRQFFAAFIVSVVFAGSAFGDEKKIQVRWEELAGVVQGKKVQMSSVALRTSKGKCKASTTSGRYEKGVQSIPRSEVSVLRFAGRSGPWHAIVD